MINPGSLTVTAPGDRDIVMTRRFHAPRQLVFDALTQPALLRRWFSGPPGWTLEVCDFSTQVGGTFRYVWRGPDGTELAMGGTVLEFTPPSRIVSTEKFDQAWYPGEAVGTIELTEDAGVTTLTMTVRYQSPEAREAVLKTPMADGVGAGYNSLESLLTQLQAEASV